jgi:hypothetical protein
MSANPLASLLLALTDPPATSRKQACSPVSHCVPVTQVFAPSSRSLPALKHDQSSGCARQWALQARSAPPASSRSQRVRSTTQVSAGRRARLHRLGDVRRSGYAELILRALAVVQAERPRGPRHLRVVDHDGAGRPGQRGPAGAAGPRRPQGDGQPSRHSCPLRGLRPLLPGPCRERHDINPRAAHRRRVADEGLVLQAPTPLKTRMPLRQVSAA